MPTFMAGLASKQFAFWGPELSGRPHVKSATAGLIPPSPAPAGLNRWAAHLAALFLWRNPGPSARGFVIQVRECLGVLAQRHSHTAEVDRHLEAHLPSAQFKDNAVRISEPRDSGAARNR